MVKIMNKRLKGKIVERFGSQFEFSRFIGLHESIISQVVRGHRSLTEKERSEWAEILQADESIFDQEASNG